MSLPTVEMNRLIRLIGVHWFGLTSLFAVVIPAPLEALIPATVVTGFLVLVLILILIPLVVVLGEDSPLVASDEPDASVGSGATAENPIAALRERDLELE